MIRGRTPVTKVAAAGLVWLAYMVCGETGDGKGLGAVLIGELRICSLQSWLLLDGEENEGSIDESNGCKGIGDV